MLAKKLLGAASVVALLAAPISAIADEVGGAMGEGLTGWLGTESAVEGVKNGALAGLAVGAGVGLGFGISELADDDDSSGSSTTTTTTTTGP